MAAFLRGLCLDLFLLPVIVLALPWILFLIVVRRRGVGAFFERLGGWRVPPADGRPRLWIHCVSVGELQAVGPLLEELARARPDATFILSVTTTTARDIARSRYPSIPTFLYPIDLSLCVRRVLGRVRPDAIVLVELEVWPQLVLLASSRKVPLFVVNGRISARSFPRLRKVRFLARPIFARLTEVHARDEECAERFRALGVASERVHTLGNLKLDRPALADPAAVRERFEAQFGFETGAPRWVAGCTHPGEEEIVLEAHRTLRESISDLSLLLAPRHIERAPEVIALAKECGFEVVAASAFLKGEPTPPDRPRPDRPRADRPRPDVVVLDEIGRLAELYAVGEVAFVGGSLIERGGHNLLEPILCGVATVHGPHMANFRELVEWLTGGGISIEVTAETLAASVRGLLEESEARNERARAGLARLAESQGSAAKSAERILARLDRAHPPRNGAESATSPAASVESPPASR